MYSSSFISVSTRLSKYCCRIFLFSSTRFLNPPMMPVIPDRIPVAPPIASPAMIRPTPPAISPTLATRLAEVLSAPPNASSNKEAVSAANERPSAIL